MHERRHGCCIGDWSQREFINRLTPDYCSSTQNPANIVIVLTKYIVSAKIKGNYTLLYSEMKTAIFKGIKKSIFVFVKSFLTDTNTSWLYFHTFLYPSVHPSIYPSATVTSSKIIPSLVVIREVEGGKVPLCLHPLGVTSRRTDSHMVCSIDFGSFIHSWSSLHTPRWDQLVKISKVYPQPNHIIDYNVDCKPGHLHTPTKCCLFN